METDTVDFLKNIDAFLNTNFVFDENYLLQQYTHLVEKTDFQNFTDCFGRELDSFFCKELSVPTKQVLDQIFSGKGFSSITYCTLEDNCYEIKGRLIAQASSDEKWVSLVIRDQLLDDQSTKQKKLFENIVMDNWDAIVFANMEGTVEFANPAAYELYGYEPGELIGENVDIFNSHLSHNTDDIVASIKENGYWRGELIQRKKDDSTFNALLEVQLMMGKDGIPIGLSSHSKDISESKSQKEALKKTIAEKDILLQELHHRVKNNLSIIRGMLSLQGANINDEAQLEIIDVLKNRINAIASLHNTLFNSNNLSDINFSLFIHSLCIDLENSFENPDKKINLNIKADHYRISLSNAIPLGLIVNEVLTNSYKHAFENKENGEINIRLENNNEKTIITIRDNGPGFDFEKIKDSSLGISLIQGLVEQVDAEFEFINDNGTKFQLTISKND